MFDIIRHNREFVTFYGLESFRRTLSKSFGTPLKDVKYDPGNKGVIINGKKWNWTNLASELGWFDEAEIVTDCNDKEKVMTWLNLD